MPICYKLSSGGSGRSGSLVFSPEIWQPQRTEARLGRKHQQDKKTKRQKDGKGMCCAHSAPTTYLLHISLLAVTRHTWTHTLHPTEP